MSSHVNIRLAAVEGADARVKQRVRALKGGAILRGMQNSEIRCTIRNMHEDGALLQVDPGARLPNEFLLYVAVDGVAYQCKLRWRQGGRAGVQFHGTEPKPRWHYG